MTTTGFATPARAAAPRVRRPTARPLPPRPPGRARSSFGRVLVWSLAASLAVHLALILVPPFMIDVAGHASSAAPPQAAAPSRFGLEMIEVVPTANAPALPPVAATPQARAPTQAPSTSRPQPGQTGTGQTTPAPGATEPSGGSVRDALQPGYRDPRLYAPVDKFPELRRSAHERYMEHLQARIDAVNDSLGMEASRNRRTSDWTITDDSGNRWGLSPDGLHLGGVTIPRAVLPLPAPTGDNQTIEAERERQRQRDEIQRQEDAGERARTGDERIEAIREREDAQRRGGDGS